MVTQKNEATQEDVSDLGNISRSTAETARQHPSFTLHLLATR